MIEIVPYEAAWPGRFVEEAARIRARFNERALRIDHVGSTSVPGLAAKPVIDIQVSVIALTPRRPLMEDMESLSYAHLDLGDFDRVYPYFRRPSTWPHSHHVHLCEAGGEQERRHLAFRDFLRLHAREAEEYAELKRELARLHGVSVGETYEDYSMAKTDFVEAIIERAYAMGLPEYGPSDG
jgi:GrpB-like predicted nucleotidyltransferase (UPF0157 family)